jgi:endonuclease/exonuclease/phosphatase (EEP) superfamily protein YafD
LRIDHQFYGEGFRAIQFETLRDVKGSDHFPLKGYYELLKDASEAK